MQGSKFTRAEILLVIVVGISLFAGIGFAQNAHLGTETELTRSMQQNSVEDRRGEFAPRGKATKAEEAAYKAFLAAQKGDPSATIQLGELFVARFPASVYLADVYGILTSSYFAIGDMDKMFTAGNRAIQLDPANVDAMSMLAMAISRRVKGNTPEGARQLQSAEAYAHRTIEIIPTMTKPGKAVDPEFEKAKKDKLALAHSGLGLIAFNHQKYDEARTELTQAVQLAAMPDPVDYYLLGNADARGGYYQEAIAAYEKCSDSGPLVADCKAHAESARRDMQTNLSR